MVYVLNGKLITSRKFLNKYEIRIILFKNIKDTPSLIPEISIEQLMNKDYLCYIIMLVS